MDFFEDLFRTLDEYKQSKAKMLMPKKLAKELAKAAKNASIKIGGNYKDEAPNEYHVFLSGVDWDSYYSSRKEQTERLLDEKLTVWLKKHNYQIGGRLTVNLTCDRQLRLGEVKITTRFASCEPTSEAAVPSCEISLSRNPIRSRKTTTPSAPSEFSSSPLDNKRRTPAAKTYRLTASISAGRQTISVFSGCSIGVIRNHNSERPDIALPLEEYPYFSQIHGEFLCNNSGWQFRSLSGTNPTAITEPDGTTRTLRNGGRCDLEDGTIITVSGCHGVIVFRKREAFADDTLVPNAEEEFLRARRLLQKTR